MTRRFFGDDEMMRVEISIGRELRITSGIDRSRTSLQLTF